MTDQEKLLRAAGATSASILTLGTLGSFFGKKGAALGAVGGAALGGGLAGAPMMCGLFSTKEEKAEIDQRQLPIRLKVTASSVAATLIGGFLGSKVSKAHPIVGGLIGAAIGGGAVVGAIAATECPKLSSQTGTSGVFLNGAPVRFP